MKKPFSLKRMFTSRMFRAGGYSAFAAAMVVAIAVAVKKKHIHRKKHAKKQLQVACIVLYYKQKKTSG